MDEDRLREVEALLLSIREKTMSIRAKTESLVGLNKRLESFKAALDAYALKGTEERTGREHKGSPKKRMRLEKGVSGLPKPAASCEDSIGLLFTMNKAYRHTALQIHKLISENEVASLDDIVRSIKLSKYRLIEILNVLVKEKIVLKYFDKGFMYRLNKEL